MKVIICWFTIFASFYTLITQAAVLTCEQSHRHGLITHFNCTSLPVDLPADSFFDNLSDENSYCNAGDGEGNKSIYDSFKMTFVNCTLPHLPKKFFKKLENVSEIYLNNCAVNTIVYPGEVFHRSSRLKTLSFAHNKIERIYAYFFKSIQNVTHVDFSYNELMAIDEYAFKNITSLKSINLSRNRLEWLYKWTFEDAINLIDLDLSHNRLETFQVNLNNSTRMERLRLQQNRIREFNCAILPSSVAMPFSIDASLNEMKDIYLNCDMQPNSWTLNIEDNQLETLTLRGRVNNLEALYASRNKIRRIFCNGFIPKLKELRLSTNNFRQMDNDTFGRFVNLEYLYVDNNNLSKIDIGALRTKLKLVNISYNNLENFDFHYFMPGNRNLSEVYLNGNKLAKINNLFEEELPSLHTLKLSDNHFSCSYSQQFLLEHQKLCSFTPNTTDWNNSCGLKYCTDNNNGDARMGQTSFFGLILSFANIFRWF